MARLYSGFVEPVDPRNWPSDGPTISEVRGIIQWAKSSQVTWLRKRRACGYNFACIEHSYLKRIAELEECPF